MKNAILGIVAFAALGAASSAQASTVLFNFGQGKDKALSNHVTFTSSGYALTAYGFNENGTTHDLYNKNRSGETGLGLKSTDDSELTLSENGKEAANFIQLDVSKINHFSETGFIAADSVTSGEKFDIFGSNMKGQKGAFLFASSTKEKQYIALKDWDDFKYISMSVHPHAGHGEDNVLLRSVEFKPVAVPLPAAAWSGLSGLAVIAAIGLKNRKQSAAAIA